ncbi:MAG TPA: sulfur carrier protein ThiS [Vicinamibacterales bacterium]|nr:sulfur carrier protein ThiS [Vicinamibacterales bacterium]
MNPAVIIKLNGDPYEIPAPVSVTGLLAKLDIDPRRVAVEHNLIIVKKDAFDRTTIGDGDELEIVNFVGGG